MRLSRQAVCRWVLRITPNGSWREWAISLSGRSGCGPDVPWLSAGFMPETTAVLFGLPGNPVAVMISFYFFVRDALLYMMGALPSPLLPVRAQAAANFSKREGRTEFQRGVVSQNADGTLTVRTTGEQGSGILRSMTEANCIVVLPEGSGKIRAGDWVEVVLFEGLV